MKNTYVCLLCTCESRCVDAWTQDQMWQWIIQICCHKISLCQFIAERQQMSVSTLFEGIYRWKKMPFVVFTSYIHLQGEMCRCLHAGWNQPKDYMKRYLLQAKLRLLLSILTKSYCNTNILLKLLSHMRINSYIWILIHISIHFLKRDRE